MHPTEMTNKTELMDIVFRDPLSEVTRRIRRNLLVISLLAIVVSIDRVNIVQVLWFRLQGDVAINDIISGAFSIALLYLFLIFIVYFMNDRGQYLSAKMMARFNDSYGNLHDIKLAFHSILRQCEVHKDDVPSLELAVKSLFDGNDAQFKIRLERNIKMSNDALDRYKRLRFGQWVKLYILDLGFPLFIAVFALYKVAPSFSKFICLVM